MDEQERMKELERQLERQSQRSERAEKRLNERESVVAALRNRLDKVQSQLSGERQLRKWLPRF